MSLFNQPMPETEAGYISGALPDVFPVKREIIIRVFSFKGTYFFRTRDIASLLGIRQQFEFTNAIRKRLGENTVLTGSRTKAFREAQDSSKTTFVSAPDLLKFLTEYDYACNRTCSQELFENAVKWLGSYS